MRPTLIRLLLMASLALWLLPQSVRGQAAISIDGLSAQNNFPTGITFGAEVQTPAGGVAAATIEWQPEGEGIERAALAVAAGQTTLSYTWDPRPRALPPGARVTYRWQVEDTAGNHAESPAQTMTYEDTRFAWRTLETSWAEVWWHDAGAALGEQALDLANRAVEHQRRVFQSSLEGPVRVMLYNSAEEFSAWQPGTPAFVGGRAFPAINVTAQLAAVDGPQADWLAAVIPHEVSRLYFHQATGGSPEAPMWLDQGLALYNETANHRREEQALQAGVVGQALLPLAGLGLALESEDENMVRLAQAEAGSAVQYLMYRYGPERLSTLLAAYRGGASHEEAFARAFSRTPVQFEDEWLIWLGVPAAWRGPAPATAIANTAAGSPTTNPLATGAPAGAAVPAAIASTGAATGPGHPPADQMGGAAGPAQTSGRSSFSATGGDRLLPDAGSQPSGGASLLSWAAAVVILAALAVGTLAGRVAER